VLLVAAIGTPPTVHVLSVNARRLVPTATKERTGKRREILGS
jgi:hypothetical protein